MKLSKNGAQQGSSMFLMFFMMMIMLLIFLNPGLFGAIGAAIGYVLSPVIGFDGRLPLMTILCASLIMSTISTLIRHHFINWADMAKNQKIMAAFNKERRDAMMSRNTAKLEKLSKLNPEIMKKTMKSSTGQLKPMMFTMVIIILFFAWLSSFLMTGVPYTTFSVPWNYFVPLRSAILFPFWIMLYFLTSLPSGMMLQRVFKYFSFKKKIRQMKEDGLLDSRRRRDDRDEKKDKGKGRRERAEVHFNCTICSNNVRKGSWAYKCKCGKYYHEHCLPKIRKCSTCGNIISED